MKIPFLLIFFFATAVLTPSMPSAATSDDMDFVHIGLEDGLSQSTVLSIVQDPQGNLWFATYDGLNRYDGYGFTVYRNDATDSTSISDAIVRTVVTDSKGRVWAGTYSGLSMYDDDAGCFRNYTVGGAGTSGEVNLIVPVEEDILLLGTSSGIGMFDAASGEFADIALPERFAGEHVTAMTGYGGTVFLGTREGGLMAMDVASGEIREIACDAFRGWRVQSLFMDEPGILWVGTEGYGMFRIDLGSGKGIRYSTSSGNLSSDYVRCICRAPDGKLWIGTFTSLNILDEKTGECTVHDSDPVRPGSLSQSSVRSIYRDIQGGMWLGTYFGGINYWHPLTKRFSAIRNIPYHNSLNNNVVSCIAEDTDGTVWIGTNSGGINRYDPVSGKFTFYTVADGLGANDIKALYIDDNHVYVGMHHGGLGIIDKRDGSIRNYTDKGGNVYAILPYGQDALMVGMVDGNIYRFSVKDRTFHLLKDGKTGERIRTAKLITMFMDSRRRLWVGTENGVEIFRTSGDTLTREPFPVDGKNIGKTFANCICEASDGRFWLGTRNGLYCIDEAVGGLEHYTVKDGLPGNVVYGILEYARERLWISGGMGLSCFSPEEKTFRNYTSSDGLQGNQFSLYSYCRTKSGEMYFGGISGVSRFVPEDIPVNLSVPEVSMTGLYVDNVLVRPGDGSGILTSDIGRTGEIRLREGRSSFTLTFAAADFVSWKQNRFAYTLEGFSDGWTYVMDPSRAATYSNLPPGKYRFAVKAANKDGIWNETPTTLDVVIMPHWYNTVWARILLAAVTVAAVFAVAHYLWGRKKIMMQLDFEKVDKERIKEVNEMKLRFFINVSHELRTPLTMISAPVNELLSKVKDKWEVSRLRYIATSTDRLLYLVNQLLDYRRSELGVFHLNVKKERIQPLLQRIYDYYRQLAASRHIDYRMESGLEDTEVCHDPQYVETILNNLLSNAFKYTPAGHSVTLSARIEGKNCVLQVSDTGEGIPAAKQDKVFERFYQADQEHIGSGIGLALVRNLAEGHHGGVSLESEEGSGSTFTVWFPAEEDAYAPGERFCTDATGAGTPSYSTNSVDMHIANASDLGGETDAVTEPGGGGKSAVMIVEDDNEIRKYLAEGLSDSFSVLTAENGQEALDKMKDTLPDIILTDVMMPIMSGIKLCRSVKQNIRTSHIPVIMLSARFDVKWQMEGLDVGADDYIPKPFSLSMIEVKVRNIVRTRNSAIRHYSENTQVEPAELALNKLDEEFLKKAVAEVGKRLDDTGFSTEQFAEAMNMSRANLHIKMKALTGAPATDFIRKIRLSKACELLKTGRYSVADISAMTGFSSPSYFATSFKKHIGCMPSEYK